MSAADDIATRALCAALASELQGLGEAVETLAVRLMEDGQLAPALIAELQSFDLLAQSAHEGARVLAGLGQGSAAAETVDKVRLERLQKNLQAALQASSGARCQ